MNKCRRDEDWLEALRAETARTSQSRAAHRIGMSASVVNQVLKGIYKGRVQRVAERVRGALMNQKVVCPVLGEISCKRCQDEQGRPFGSTNPLRVAVYKSCRSGCSHSKHGRLMP
jgi:hypothetical protein